jgi:hypothetical protein
MHELIIFIRKSKNNFLYFVSVFHIINSININFTQWLDRENCYVDHCVLDKINLLHGVVGEFGISRYETIKGRVK